MIQSIGKFVRTSVTDLRSCATWADTAWLALARLGRVVSVPVNAIAAKYFGRHLMNPHWLLVHDIVLRTEHGTFYCRRGTADFGQASALYEQDHRGLFDLREGVFVDVGANIGRYTVMVARQLGARGAVVALEPEPGNFAALCRNVTANGLENVIVRQVACSNANTPVRLVRHRWDAGLDTTRALEADEFVCRGFVDTIEVEGRRLDSLLDELGISRVDLLKIDVEGAELAVLEGADRVLASNSSLRLLVEAWSEGPGRFLGERGFRLRRIRESDRNVDYVAEHSARGAPPEAALARPE
jgi:FkbM family methyltransferase